MRIQVLGCCMALGACIANSAWADLAGQVYRIEYANAGVEDCLRFAQDGRFAADSSLLLPPGIWRQQGLVYTAYQSDVNGNTFTWGGAQLSAQAGGNRLIGAFVSSLGIRLGFAGTEDPQCEVSFEEPPLPEALVAASAAADGGEETYEIRLADGTTADCLRLGTDGEFTADTLTALGFAPGAWHGSGITVAAFHSGDGGEGFSANSWGGILLAGDSLWLAVDSSGARALGRRNPACTLGARGAAAPP